MFGTIKFHNVKLNHIHQASFMIIYHIYIHQYTNIALLIDLV